MSRPFSLFLKSFIFLIVVAGITYMAGPRPKQPVLNKPVFSKTSDLPALEAELQAAERAEPGIKPACEARIVWADSTKKQKTRLAFLYLHGFGASHEEGAPLPQNIADTFGMNLYLARMSEHGVEEGDENLCALTADKYYESAERALHIAQQLGDSVVILATSGGGALGLFLCSRHPEVKAIVTWSPAVALADPAAELLNGPWGVQLARFVRGSHHNDYPFKQAVMHRYWTNHQCWEGVVQFSLFVKNAMTPATFAAIKCPVFVGYYYENEEKQDRLVSVAAMKAMMPQLGTPPEQRQIVNFPNSHDHVIGSRILSSDWQGVQAKSIAFLKDIAKI